jgi:hypothetical protein
MRLVEDEKGTGSDKGESMKAADILMLCSELGDAEDAEKGGKF